MVKNEFFWNNSKNNDSWILRKEQNLFRKESYMCVPSLVKIDWEMPDKNPRWPPLNWFFVISTSDRVDFPRIIVIALFCYFFISVNKGIEIKYMYLQYGLIIRILTSIGKYFDLRSRFNFPISVNILQLLTGCSKQRGKNNDWELNY